MDDAMKVEIESEHAVQTCRRVKDYLERKAGNAEESGGFGRRPS
jgi:hypothetical protein